MEGASHGCTQILVILGDEAQSEATTEVLDRGLHVHNI